MWKNLQDSIQILKAPKRNLNLHFSVVDTGHMTHSLTVNTTMLVYLCNTLGIEFASNGNTFLLFN